MLIANCCCGGTKLRPCPELRRSDLANQSPAWRGNKTTFYFDFLLGGRGPSGDLRYAMRLLPHTLCAIHLVTLFTTYAGTDNNKGRKHNGNTFKDRNNR